MRWAFTSSPLLRPLARRMTTSTAPPSRYIDIGANLTCSQFLKPRGASKQSDFDAMLERAQATGLSDIIITGADLEGSREALALARGVNASGRFPTLRLHCTVGCHPTHSSQLEEVVEVDAGCETVAAVAASAAPAQPRLSRTAYIDALDSLIADGLADGTVCAVGECGLDYDRLHFASKDAQLAAFPLHFDLAEKYGLPLFLHDRNTGGDFAGALARRGGFRVVATRAYC